MMRLIYPSEAGIVPSVLGIWADERDLAGVVVQRGDDHAGGGKRQTRSQAR